MEKRYIKYQSVPEGNFKPNGTLGQHHCSVICQDDVKVVIGSVAGRVMLKPGDTLCYEYGTVWLVPRTESYSDPIRRILAQAHLSQKMLEYSPDPVEFTVSRQDTSRWHSNSAAYPSTGKEAAVFGTHVTENLKSRDHGRRCRITGGDAIVIRKTVGCETTAYRPRRATRIVVRPTADIEAVSEFLFEELLPAGRERRLQRENRQRFLAALKDVLLSQGMHVVNDTELARIGELYRVVSDNRYRRKEITIGNVGYRLSWNSFNLYVSRFFWECAYAPQSGDERAQINFVAALRSGLLESWVEATKNAV